MLLLISFSKLKKAILSFSFGFCCLFLIQNNVRADECLNMEREYQIILDYYLNTLDEIDELHDEFLCESLREQCHNFETRLESLGQSLLNKCDQDTLVYKECSKNIADFCPAPPPAIQPKVPKKRPRFRSKYS